jgi:hypothetical protein
MRPLISSEISHHRPVVSRAPAPLSAPFWAVSREESGRVWITSIFSGDFYPTRPGRCQAIRYDSFTSLRKNLNSSCKSLLLNPRSRRDMNRSGRKRAAGQPTTSDPLVDDLTPSAWPCGDFADPLPRVEPESYDAIPGCDPAFCCRKPDGWGQRMRRANGAGSRLWMEKLFLRAPARKCGRK